MKSSLSKHIAVWAIYFGLQILAYVQSWSSQFWTITAINFTLAIFVFYLCSFFATGLYKKLSINKLPKNITRYKAFWCIMGLMAFFIGTRLFFDLVIFNPGSGVSITEYAVYLSSLGLSIMIPGMLMGLSVGKDKLISKLNFNRKELESQIETLAAKEIHLTSVTEAKEHAIKEMEEKLDELQFNKEMLARDLDEMEKRLNQLSLRNEELQAQQKTMEGELERVTALNTFMERDKKVTDMLYFRLNDIWERRVNHYKRILQLHGINDTDHLPGLN